MKNSLQGTAIWPVLLKVTSLLFFILSYIFSIAQPGIWQKKQSLGINPTGRGGGVGFSIGNKGYFGTGFSPTEYFKNDFWEYDPATNAWTQKANFGGTPRAVAIAFSIGNKGYVGTGVDCEAPFCYTKDFWEYDLALNKWTRKEDLPGIPTASAVGFSIGNKGYLGTGVTNDGSEWTPASRQFWEYDPALNKWTRKADFAGSPTASAVGFSIGNKGYLGTGDTTATVNGLESISQSRQFWEYDPATDKWSRKADFGGLARSAATAFSIGTKGFIATGEFQGSVLYSNDFWEYDPATNVWTPKTPFGGDFRASAAGFSIGNKGYLGFGRGYNSDMNDLWEYIPGTENPITARASTTTFCSVLPYVISYATSGTFNADNVFTAQLSDITGSFKNYSVIGSVSSSVSGTINAHIPRLSGANFRIRVISSSPAISGNDDGTIYTINPRPVVKTKNITVNLNAQCTVTITPDQVNNGSTGYCGGLSYTLDKTTFNYANIGDNTVTLTVKDTNDRISTGQAIVTVLDHGCLVQLPITYYRDYDGDGFGDPYHPTSFPIDVPPAGYVRNNYDCYDCEGGNAPGQARVRMCHDGWTQCVYAKDTAEKLRLGWSLGICPLQSCAGDETLMCHNGKQECVKTTAVAAKLAEAGGKWSMGPYCSGVPISGSGSKMQKKIDMAGMELSPPARYSLSNYPNPFAGTSTIKYELPLDSRVSIKVYDLAGRAVATLVDAYKKAGTYTVNFNATSLSSGSLFYKIIARSKDSQFELTNQMVKIK